MESKIEYRQAKRDCFCRGCDRLVKKNTEKVIYTYSWRNRGITIYFCQDCIREIQKLVNEGSEHDTN